MVKVTIQNFFGNGQELLLFRRKVPYRCSGGADSMDAELKAYLDGLRDDLTHAIVNHPGPKAGIRAPGGWLRVPKPWLGPIADPVAF